MSEPKFRKGQLLINKATGKEIIIDTVKRQRLITRNYSGFVDEFTGEYLFVSFDDKGKKEHGDASEEVLLKDFDTPSNRP